MSVLLHVMILCFERPVDFPSLDGFTLSKKEKKKKHQIATTIKFVGNILSNQEASIYLLSLSIREQTE